MKNLMILSFAVAANFISFKVTAQCSEVPRKINYNIPASLGLSDSDRIKFSWALKKAYGYTNKKFAEAKVYTNKKFDSANSYTDQKFEESESYTDTKVDEVDKKLENFKNCVNSRVEKKENHDVGDSVISFKQQFLNTKSKDQELIQEQMRTINSLRTSRYKTTKTLLWCGGTAAGILVGLIVHNNQQWFDGRVH